MDTSRTPHPTPSRCDTESILNGLSVTTHNGAAATAFFGETAFPGQWVHERRTIGLLIAAACRRRARCLRDDPRIVAEERCASSSRSADASVSRRRRPHRLPRAAAAAAAAAPADIIHTHLLTAMRPAAMVLQVEGPRRSTRTRFCRFAMTTSNSRSPPRITSRG